jgi:hypothetical protein
LNESLASSSQVNLKSNISIIEITSKIFFTRNKLKLIKKTMKMYNKIRTTGMTLAIGLFTFACGPETQNETNEAIDEAQVEMSEENREANAELNDFNVWVTDNTKRADEVTEAEYRKMRQEYKRREAELEARSSTWDESTRREWEETKNEWNNFENSIQRRLGKLDDLDIDVDVNRDRN